MKRRSKAGGKSAKAQPSESLKLKPDTVPKAAAGRSSAMQQTADWLERLGLGQHAQRFAENDISFSVLPDLTDQDLKEIGVSLGHRRQLLRAIAELTGREKGGRNVCDAQHKIIGLCCGANEHISGAPPRHGATLEPRAVSRGRDALGYYHERQDEKRNVGLGPEHDWSSHAAGQGR
jgi:hypothetical protein